MQKDGNFYIKQQNDKATMLDYKQTTKLNCKIDDLLEFEHMASYMYIEYAKQLLLIAY